MRKLVLLFLLIGIYLSLSPPVSASLCTDEGGVCYPNSYICTGGFCTTGSFWGCTTGKKCCFDASCTAPPLPTATPVPTSPPVPVDRCSCSYPGMCLGSTPYCSFGAFLHICEDQAGSPGLCPGDNNAWIGDSCDHYGDGSWVTNCYKPETSNYYCGYSSYCQNQGSSCNPLDIVNCTTVSTVYSTTNCGVSSCSQLCGYLLSQIICCNQPFGGSVSPFCPGLKPYYCSDICRSEPVFCAGYGSCVPTPPPGATNTPVPPTNTPTPTSTPTATPTPGAWVKIKDSSFASTNDLINNIPLVPVAYDVDDDATANFIVAQGGLVSAPSVNLTEINATAKPSTNDWSISYTSASSFSSPTSFLSYVKARKSYKEISSLDDIDADGIYLYTGPSPLQITTNHASLNSYNAIIFTASVVEVALASFNPAKSVAILSPAINFDPTVTYAKAIFIGTDIMTGKTVNQGLKIKGNLVAQSTLTNNREWADLNKPSLFIVNDYQQYLDLLPYLSVANYEWRQIQ